MNRNMRNIKGGLRFDEDDSDQQKQPVQFTGIGNNSGLAQSIGLDDMFGMKKKPVVPPKKESKLPLPSVPGIIKNQQQQRKKQQERKKEEEKKNNELKKKQQQRRKQQERKKEQERKNNQLKKKQQQRKRQQERKKEEEKKNNELKKKQQLRRKQQERKKEEDRKNQDKRKQEKKNDQRITSPTKNPDPPNLDVGPQDEIHHQQQEEEYIRPNIPQYQNIQDILDKFFNRPAYIRKLKKVAEVTKYRQQNQSSISVEQVCRLSECYYKQIKKLNQSQFVDSEFPPNFTAFVDCVKNKEKVTGFDNWKKFKEAFKSPNVGKYIDPNDIQKGSFKTQFLISCLASLAQNESNIKRIIQEQTYTQTGFYYARINYNGVWRYVVVDQFISHDSNGNISFSHSYDDQQSDLWSTIIEKAYTKINGTYEQYSRPQSRQEILRNLTGAPVKLYNLENVSIIDRIKKSIMSGYVVQAVPNSNIIQKGLNPNYTLTVLNINNKGNIQYRNSFGTIQQKPKINMSKEGVFELSFSESRNHISHFLIAEIHDNYKTTTIQTKHQYSYYTSYSFTVKNHLEGYISVNQIDKQYFSQLNPEHNNPAYNYSPIKLLVYQKHDNDNYTIVASSSSKQNKYVDVKINLGHGDYIVILIGIWVSKWYDLTLNFYANQLVTLKRVYNKFNLNLIALGLEQTTIREGSKNLKNGIQEYIYLHPQTNLLVLTAVNKNPKQIKFTKDFSKINLGSLVLINAKSKKDVFAKKFKQQLIQYKQKALTQKVWSEDLQPNQTLTWVFGSQENINQTILRSLGARM